jgi:hypothetical protein
MIKPGTWTLILSDHGFGPIRRELRVGNWLRTPEARLGEGEIEDIFALDKSDAARLYIREPGRDPGGRLSPAERAALQGKLSAGLAATVDPANGRKPVEAVYPQDKVFVGKWAEKGPNLSVLPSYGYFISLGDMDTGFKLPPYGNVLLTLSGWHRMNGIYLLRGPGARSGHLEASVSLLDVAPTCLYLLGRPLPQDFDGKIMSPVLQDAWVRGHKASYQGRLSEENRPLTPEEQRALKNLPYVGG